MVNSDACAPLMALSGRHTCNTLYRVLTGYEGMGKLTFGRNIWGFLFVLMIGIYEIVFRTDGIYISLNKMTDRHCELKRDSLLIMH